MRTNRAGLVRSHFANWLAHISSRTAGRSLARHLPEKNKIAQFSILESRYFWNRTPVLVSLFYSLMVGVTLQGLTAHGQITVSIDLDQREFLRSESLPLKVRISNLSGRNLRIGETKDWLTFVVETRDGKVVAPITELRAGGNFELENAASVTKTLDLTAGYDFEQSGRYRVTAIAKFEDLKLEVASSAAAFEIIPGTRLWEQTCGIPGTKSTPQWIRYSLLQTTEMKSIKLFVRISDEQDQRIARVVRLGSVVSFSQPERSIDRASALHVLFQNGARVFDHVVLNHEGAILSRQTYEFGGSRPRLMASDEGVVTVKGGRLKATPPPKTSP